MQSRAEPSRAKQSREGKRRDEKSKAEQSRAEQNIAEQRRDAEKRRERSLLPISTGSSRSFTLQQFLVCEKVSRDFRGDLCLHFRVEVDVALLCERFLARGSFLGVGARGRRPFESADPGRGSGVCGYWGS